MRNLLILLSISTIITGCYNSDTVRGVSGTYLTPTDNYNALISGQTSKTSTTTATSTVPHKIDYNNQDFVPDYAMTYERKFIKTQEAAEKINLELPMRCEVNWESQDLIANQVLGPNSFFIERMDKGDDLPQRIVDNLSFKDTPADKVIYTILQGTGIELYSFEPSFTKIDLEDAKGTLASILDLISKKADIYYKYDARKKVLYISRTGKWSVHLSSQDKNGKMVPFDKEIILAVEDALRGAGVDNLVVDWEDSSITTSGDFLTENTLRQTINLFKAEKYLIAYDVNVYRVYPKGGKPINWTNMIKAFRQDTIKVSTKGVLGRALSVSGNLDISALAGFLKPYAQSVLISQGTSVLPNHWKGRFDIGQCSRDVRIETDMFMMMDSQYTERENQQNKLDMKVVLRTSKGDITKFSVPTRIGENVLILGIPTHYFVPENTETVIDPNTELVIFMSPRIITMLDPDDAPSNN